MILTSLIDKLIFDKLEIIVDNRFKNINCINRKSTIYLQDNENSISKLMH